MPLEVRQDWLDSVNEPIIDPDRRVIDPEA